MTELNHQGITKALANLHKATTANTDATAAAAAAAYATPPGQPAKPDTAMPSPGPGSNR